MQKDTPPIRLGASRRLRPPSGPLVNTGQPAPDATPSGPGHPSPTTPTSPPTGRSAAHVLSDDPPPRFAPAPVPRSGGGATSPRASVYPARPMAPGNSPSDRVRGHLQARSPKKPLAQPLQEPAQPLQEPAPPLAPPALPGGEGPPPSAGAHPASCPGWLHLMPADGTNPRRLRALHIHAHSPALATPQGREQAWADFLQWADRRLQDPEGPSWEDMEQLIAHVLPAVQQALDGTLWLQLQLRARMRTPDPKALRLWLFQAVPAHMPWFDNPALRDLIRLCHEAKADRSEWDQLLQALRQRPGFARLPTNAHLLPLLNPPTGAQRLGTQPCPRPDQDTARPDPLPPWFRIERAGPGGDSTGPVRYWVPRGPQAPRTPDDREQAQEAVLTWALRELADPRGLRWPTLMDTIKDIEGAWQYRFDRQRLLALCVWTAEEHKDPGPLLQFLHLLEGCEAAECPLAGLIEQARNGHWASPIRSALLQAIGPRLPTLDDTAGPLHAQYLDAVLTLPDPGDRHTLLRYYLTSQHVDTSSETGRLIKAVLRQEATPPAPLDEWLELLRSLQRREGTAVWAVWRVLCGALLQGAAPRLVEGQPSADARLTKASHELIRQLLFRLAHPERGDKAQAIERQFELLGALVGALPRERRQAFLEQLDGAYAQHIDEALVACLEHPEREAPITALAMRGAIRVLSAALRDGPTGPAPRQDNSTTGKAVRFFADWFAALRQPGTADLSGIKLLHQAQLFQVRMDPLTRDLTALMNGLFKLHELSP